MITPQDLPAALSRFPELVSQGHITGILATLPQQSALRQRAWSSSDIMDGARELRHAALFAGAKLSLGDALKIACAAYGFSSWNTALAALGPREAIAIPETVSALSSRVERLSYCSPLCLHGNFPGLVNRLLGDGTEKLRRTAPATSFDGALSSEGPNRSMLVLSHHLKDFERLKARYPIQNVLFMDLPFQDAIWQALRLDFDHIVIDRPNEVAPVPFKAFRLISEAFMSGHNVIISTENPEAIWGLESYVRDRNRAYEAFLAA